jgi:hypothetical protein
MNLDNERSFIKMNLYEKIKEFTAICPASINIGEYLKDATYVSKIYYEMLSLERIDNFDEVQKIEKELDNKIVEILNRWKN